MHIIDSMFNRHAKRLRLSREPAWRETVASLIYLLSSHVWLRNDLDRFHLVMDVIDRVPGLAANAAAVRDEMVASRRHAVEHTRRYGDDVPEIRDWAWMAAR